MSHSAVCRLILSSPEPITNAGSTALKRDLVRAFGEAVDGLEPADWAHLCAVTPAAALGLRAAVEPGAEARFSVLGPDGALSALLA